MLDKEWLKLTRVRLDLSMNDVAKRMRVTRQTIMNIENGVKIKESTIALYELTLKEIMKERGGLRELILKDIEK